jgi:ribosome biogenesis GTPase
VSFGIDATFPEISELASECRFRDCKHESEPGCAVLAAVEAGAVAADRLKRYRKLVREDAQATETIAQARERFRKLGKAGKATPKRRR